MKAIGEKVTSYSLVGEQSSGISRQMDPDKPMTYKEVEEMMAKAKDESRMKKNGILPKYLPEMDLVLYPPKFKQPTFWPYSGKGLTYNTWSISIH